MGLQDVSDNSGQSRAALPTREEFLVWSELCGMYTFVTWNVPTLSHPHMPSVSHLNAYPRPKPRPPCVLCTWSTLLGLTLVKKHQWCLIKFRHRENVVMFRETSGTFGLVYAQHPLGYNQEITWFITGPRTGSGLLDDTCVCSTRGLFLHNNLQTVHYPTYSTAYKWNK